MKDRDDKTHRGLKEVHGGLQTTDRRLPVDEEKCRKREKRTRGISCGKEPRCLDARSSSYKAKKEEGGP